MDFAKIREMLSHTYWAIDISLEEVKKGASNSALNIGAFHGNEQMGTHGPSRTGLGSPTSWTYAWMRGTGAEAPAVSW